MQSDERYFFWDKKRDELGFLTVISVSDSSFRFSYRGNTFKCSLAYADGKLFRDSDDVPEVQELHRRIERSVRRAENSKANYAYTPSTDTWVLPGD